MPNSASLIQLIVVVVVLGVFAYLVENYLPMSPPFKVVLRVLIVLGLLIYILRFFGLLMKNTDDLRDLLDRFRRDAEVSTSLARVRIRPAAPDGIDEISRFRPPCSRRRSRRRSSSMPKALRYKGQPAIAIRRLRVIQGACGW